MRESTEREIAWTIVKVILAVLLLPAILAWPILLGMRHGKGVWLSWWAAIPLEVAWVFILLVVGVLITAIREKVKSTS